MSVLPRVGTARRRPLGRHFDGRGGRVKKGQVLPRGGGNGRRRVGPRDTGRRAVRPWVLGPRTRRIVAFFDRDGSPHHAVQNPVDGERGRPSRTAGTDGHTIMTSTMVVMMSVVVIVVDFDAGRRLSPTLGRRGGFGHDCRHAERQ